MSEKFCRSRHVVGGAAVLIASLVANPPTAHAACDTFYRIAAGDTLRSISVNQLGHDRYTEIFQANQDIVSRPDRIEIGQLLYLPCSGPEARTRATALQASNLTATSRDDLGDKRAELEETADLAAAQPLIRKQLRAADAPGQSTQAAANLAPETDSDTVREPSTNVASVTLSSEPISPSAQPRRLRLLTGGGLDPLVGETLQSGGLAVEIIKQALREAGSSDTIEVAVIDDWGSHRSVLMPTGAFHLAFPWIGDGCEGSGASQSICRDFTLSRPIYQVTETLLTQSGDPLATSTSATGQESQIGDGAVVCRQDGLGKGFLGQLGQAVSVVKSPDLRDCFDLLLDGKVQLVSAPLPMTEGLLQHRAYRGKIEELSRLRRDMPVRALALNDDVTAKEVIGALDRGLTEIQGSGLWFKLVSSYLTAFNQKRLEN
ncbi:MAG: hypothetical protein AAF666_18660 [Pseudomonadota bacterium]